MQKMKKKKIYPFQEFLIHEKSRKDEIEETGSTQSNSANSKIKY